METARPHIKIVVAAAAALALSAAPAAAKGHPRKITIEARSQLENVKLVDNAPAGDSPGDVLVFTEQLFDLHGKRIGSDAASCVRLFDATSLCTGVYKLPGGQVMVQLLQPGPTGTYDQAVTGGTGRFAGARGTVTVAQSPSGDRFTFRLRALGGSRSGARR
jgi:hypothetical protein